MTGFQECRRSSNAASRATTAERLIVQGLKRFGGNHCETSALKRVLDHHGLSSSEEMLLGLGGGVGFIYWYMKLVRLLLTL